jgi:exonuclease III
LSKLDENSILKNWSPVKKPKFRFQEAHHKMSDRYYNQLKRLILQKNPEKNIDKNIMIMGDFNSCTKEDSANGTDYNPKDLIKLEKLGYNDLWKYSDMLL